MSYGIIKTHSVFSRASIWGPFAGVRGYCVLPIHLLSPLPSLSPCLSLHSAHTAAVPARRPLSVGTIAVCTAGRRVLTARRVSQEGNLVEQVGLGEVLSGPGFRCSPFFRARPHGPCLAALSRSMCGASGNPDSLPGPVPESCSQTNPYCLRQMEPVTYKGELGRYAMVSCSRARFRK